MSIDDSSCQPLTPRKFTLTAMPAMPEQRDLSTQLPKVNIYEDPGIWICLDEGCNSNCHGEEWAKNVEEKLDKITRGRKQFTWVHRREKSFKGIGSASVKTTGKRALPACFKLKECGKLVPGTIESHEQEGRHPLLLSDSSQARMGMVKDMRLGKVTLKDYDDSLDIYSAEGSGLKVICVSHFPKDLIPELFVEPCATQLREQQEKAKAVLLKRSPRIEGIAKTELLVRQISIHLASRELLARPENQ